MVSDVDAPWRPACSPRPLLDLGACSERPSLPPRSTAEAAHRYGTPLPPHLLLHPELLEPEPPHRLARHRGCDAVNMRRYGINHGEEERNDVPALVIVDLHHLVHYLSSSACVERAESLLVEGVVLWIVEMRRAERRARN